MAGVAEAMAASSLLIDASSSASLDENSHKEKFHVSRTCVCRKPACARMSAAFGLAQDPRGDFVVVPSGATELRAVFNRYLHPEQDKQSNCEYIDRVVSNNGGHEGECDASYSTRSSSSSHSSSFSRHYNDGGDYSTHSESSRSLSSGSLRSGPRSYSSRESFSSDEKSCCSLESRGDLHSEESRGSYDRFHDRAVQSKYHEDHEHDSEGNRSRLLDFDINTEIKVENSTKNLVQATLNEEETSGNDASDSSLDDHAEGYVAVHHFHPRVVEKFLDVCLERRPEEDLVPLFVTTMTTSQRRSCGIPAEDDESDQLMDPHTGQIAEGQYWIVPSYSLEQAHEDWRELMRNRLRNQGMNRATILRLSASMQETEPRQLSSNPIQISKWDIAQALALQMIDSKKANRGEIQGEDQPNITTSPDEVDAIALKTSKKDESQAAHEESGMLSYLLSSSLTPKIISAAATNTYARQEKNCRADRSGETSSEAHPSNAESSESGDDESESNRSSASKSECTPTIPPPFSKKSKKESWKAKKTEDRMQAYSKTGTLRFKRSLSTLIAYFAVPLVVVVMMAKTARRLTHVGIELSCTTQGFVDCEKFELALEVVAETRRAFCYGATGKIEAVKGLIGWICTPNKHVMPIEAEFFRFYVWSRCQVVYLKTWEAVGAACHYVVAVTLAAYDCSCSVLHFMYTTPPKEQVDIVKAWFEVIEWKSEELDTI